MSNNNSKKQSFAKVLTTFSFIMLIFFWVFLVIEAYTSYNNIKKNGQDRFKTLTTAQSDHIALEFDSVRLTLEAVAERQNYNALFSGDVDSKMQEDLTNWLKRNKRISGLMISDSSGLVELFLAKESNRDWLKKTVKIDQQDYYLFHTYSFTGDNQSVYISQINPTNNQKMLVFSQALKDIDGNFDGVVVAFVNTQHYVEYMQSLAEVVDTNMALALNKNEIFVLNTSGISEETFASQIKDNFTQVADYSTIDLQIDDNEYLTSFKKLGDGDMQLVLSTNSNNLIDGWRKERMYDLVFLILFTLYSIIAYLLLKEMTKQIERAKVSEEQALSASQSKSEFLAKMSHELRTPLNAIIGFSEMIDTGYFGDLNKKQSERIQDINLCGKHLLHVINDILDFSKGEAGKLELYESEVQINTLVNDSVLMIRDKATSKNINIEINSLANLPKLSVDERKIRQILINLLSNALKFTREEGVISINISRDSKENIEIEVRDNGIGMSEEDIEVAFSAFGQAKQQSANYEGTGLGLPLCKMLAELHGGSIVIESKPSVGTSVTLIIPNYRVI